MVVQLGRVRVEDLDGDNVDDVFRVCSHAKLEDPLHRQGIIMKRRWLLDMSDEYGPLTKIAYLDEKPVAQILFYPEEAVPFIADPRRGAVIVRCVYNPFQEARGKGAGSALVGNLSADCEMGLRCLMGNPCSFIAAEPFETGEGTPFEDFYEANGFKKASNEMYLEVSGRYRPRRIPRYRPLPEDRGRAVILYNPMCEYSYPSSIRMRKFLKEMKPGLAVELIDEWRHPEESIKRGNQQTIVNSTPIRSPWTRREAFQVEVEEALRR